MATIQDKLAEMIAEELAPKTFSSGKEGWWAGGKVTADGKRYQVTIQAVELGR